MALVPEKVTDDFVARMFEIAKLPKTNEAQAVYRRIHHDRWRPGVYGLWDKFLKVIDAEGIKIPTHVIWRHNDRSTPFARGLELFNRLAAKSPRVELHVLDNAGRCCYRYQANAFNRAIVDFACGDSHLTQSLL